MHVVLASLAHMGVLSRIVISVEISLIKQVGGGREL